MLQQVGQLVVAQKGGAAPTKVQLRDRLPGPHRGHHQVDLLLERGQIGLGTRMMTCDDFVAGAVVAHRFTKRDVHVHRQRIGRCGHRAPAAAPLMQGLSVLLGAVGLHKAVGRGVRGVAWTTDIQTRQHVRSDMNRRRRDHAGGGNRDHGRDCASLKPCRVDLGQGHPPTTSNNSANH